MSQLVIDVQERDEKGKNANRRLRAAGIIPAVVYGGGLDSVPIQVDRGKILDLLKTQSGENTVFLLKLAGTDKSRHAMIKFLDVDAISRQIKHIDFMRIVMTEKVKVQVPIELVGESEGVKNEGGVLDFVTRTLELECLPTNIPTGISLDVSDIHIGQNVTAENLDIPEGVSLLDDPSRVVISITHSRVAAELEEMDAGLEDEELLIEAETAEPELIGKGKEEAEEEEEA